MNRAEARGAFPTGVLDRVDALLGVPEDDDHVFWGRQFDLGLAWVDFPAGLGGLGLDASWQAPIDRLVGRSRPSSRNQIGVGLVAPTLVDHASPELQRRLLRPCFTAEEIWCQLFSEPGAGSDLANLSASAKPDGDGWRVSGQKMWTSYAMSARWGLLLARTDPAVPKHQGLTCFALDMSDPGVTVLPIKQINGYARVNEVYLDDVRVPDTFRVGDVGAGWSVALSALEHERRMLGAKGRDRGAQSPVARAVELWHKHGRPEGQLDRIVRLWVRAELVRLTAERAVEEAERGEAGAGAAVGKLLNAELERDAYDLVMDVLGQQSSAPPRLRRTGRRRLRPARVRRPALGVPVLPAYDHRRRHLGDHAQRPG